VVHIKPQGARREPALLPPLHFARPFADPALHFLQHPERSGLPPDPATWDEHPRCLPTAGRDVVQVSVTQTEQSECSTRDAELAQAAGPVPVVVSPTTKRITQ